jgi:cyclic beta-1,2-glucan synthetase
MAHAELLRLLPDAPQALCAILDSGHRPVQPPIRSEIFGPQRFAQHGRSLGETHRAARAPAGTPSFFPRLKDNVRVLRQAHRYLGLQAATGYDISPAAEWLLDNFHLIEAQLKEIRDGLPRSYFRALPMLLDEPLAGLPRIYGVAWAFVAHTDGAFDEELLLHFLGAYQDTRELNLGEMWALPTTLRVVLVENLRRLAERVATHKAAREAGNLCSDRIESFSLHALDQLLVLLQRRGVGTVFLAQMAQRLSGRQSGNLTRVQEWLRRVLPDPAAQQAQIVADLAADNLSVSNAVNSLRALGDADWSDIVARSSPLMQRMLDAPVFAAEAVSTRDQTLHRIERLARRSGRSERVVAQTLLDLMRGADASQPDLAVPSHWLSGPGRAELLRSLGLHERAALLWRGAARRLVLPTYLGILLSLTLGLVTWMLWRGAGNAWTWTAAALMLFPASEAVVALVNRLISESTRPQQLPRLALAQGIPPAHRVMVVMPVMLSGAASVDELVRRLQLHYLANPEPLAQFALLSDWADAAAAQAAGDDALLQRARSGIRALNQSHPAAPGELPRFVLLHRERVFSESEQCWIGWERKRGKLEALIARLAGVTPGPFLDLGEESRVAEGTAYVLTLDSDTQLPPGRLRELVGVAAHPLNRPRLDAAARRVVGGYGILQPRIVTPLPSPQQSTPYHWLFAGQCGIDPYSAASSEVYQDLFREGTFTGKGLLDVQAMQAVLAGRLPEGRVLSHDLLEGSLARCAAVSDITLVEDAPFHADVAASRVHRWARGDWQLLPFVLDGTRYPLRAIHRWKMFDNLRRSLVAPLSLSLMLLALSGRGLTPWAALGLVLAAYATGPLISAVAGFSPSRDDIAKLHFYRQAGVDLLRAVCGALWHLVQLLQEALLSADAIVRALYRMAVSRRHLLQWTPAAVAQASAARDFVPLLRRHRQEPLAAGALLLGLWAVGTPYPLWALVLCTLWGLSPVWTWWVSRPRGRGHGPALTAVDGAYLEGIARDTWRYFERCVSAQDRHLPPDNLQTAPHDMLARRTSPTNIGLYLLSVACARQFGWIGTQELLARLEATLATVATLPQHRGHLLNWYDTGSGAALLPTYVSTVDSGNFCGHLLALAEACLELAEAPFDATAAQRALAVSRARLAPLLAARHRLSTEQRDELRWCLDDHRATRRSAALDLQAQSGVDAAEAPRRLRAVSRNCQQLALQADFSFLYHRGRHLFHIGYRVGEQALDSGFYDLLESESRLTSLFAVAKGDVPVRHWASLGRPFFAVGADAGLRSWSGSMFEYLMPTLVLDEPQGSVLEQANRAALREQIDFAAAHQVPWGISECAYAGSDHTLAYQYSPQGVPRLALRRTPSDELVIAPYATALAAQIAVRRACRNFHALQALGARARYGFIEAVDFTASRQGGAAPFSLVHTFMAHHQGMSIVALSNVLLNGAAQRWGSRSALLEAVSSLLHERTPREISVLSAPTVAPPAAVRERRASSLLREVQPGAAAVEPTHLLSNGRYGVSLRANGAGFSRWGETGLTRWRDDALRDAHGSFFYLRWPQGARKDAPTHPVSITQHPAPDPAAHYRSTFHADRVCFDAAWPGVQAHTTVWVSPEDDIEFRQVEVSNMGERTLEIELLSAFEVTLSDARADEAHPAFMNLFVRAEWQAAHQALWFERKPRLPAEAALRMAHFLADSDAQVLGLRVLTDRQRWQGRNRDASQPLADFDMPSATAYTTETLDTGLDPVCAMAVRLRIAPLAKARLTFATAASDNDGTLRAVIDKYRQPSHVQRASLMSATLAGIRLRTLRVSAETFAAIQTLSTALVLSLARPQPGSGHTDAAEVCDRRLLWRFGISGDRPVLLVSASAMQDLGLLRSLAQGLRLWSWGGIACDLVVINSEATSYQLALQRELVAMRERHAAESAAQPGLVTTALHVLRHDELSDDELSTLRSLARLHLRPDGRSLLHHVQAWITEHELALEQRLEVSTTALADTGASGVDPTSSQGEFVAGSGEFRFEAGDARRPARPWINVLSNPQFGAQLSEAGGGYTWAVNSRMNQLTPWSNDAVADPASETFLIQDRRSHALWPVAAGPRAGLGEAGALYRIAHGQGYTVISHHRGSLQVNVSWCVDPDSAVKQVRLRLVNRGSRTLHLRIAGIAEWMMGANRADRGTVHTALYRQRLPQAHGEGGSQERRLTALLCTQRERAGGFGDGTAFLALAGDADEAEDWSCDRRELFDARGRLVLPDHLGQRQGSGLDPCAALAARLTLPAGDTAERVFLLGYAESPDAARRLATTAAAVSAVKRLGLVRERWDQLLGATTVRTPDPLFDALVNRWLLYQTVSCRLWAKAGFYQAGGATGFRDQLQDAMALSWAAPHLLRDQILVAASRQFPQGDVQHWWHAPGGAGVRTHFSDDLLWLAFAVGHYLRATGDAKLLDEAVPFIEGAAIPEGAEDAYYAPAVSVMQASVYEHAARAIDRSLRVGVHGLPLMGSGDWNDGMNRVGIEGRGESVWLGWFLCAIVADFAPRARARGEVQRAQRWEQAALGWTAALNGTAWDGQWFKRAFFDDGQPLGSAANAEGRIDLIAQAWSVLSGVAPRSLQRMALAAADSLLVDQEAGLVKLLDPPLQHAQPSAGYIQAYPPGVRENGGQYTHAGVWALMAQARFQAGMDPAAPAEVPDPDVAYRYFKYLSPAHRAQHATHGLAYAIEPYVVAGDVYTQAPYVGRGGWSWYTGAAAWLHRAAIESIFGLQFGARELSFTPCLPTHWPRAELSLRRNGRTMRFVFVRGDAQAALDLSRDELPGARLLQPATPLDWSRLPEHSVFVVPLLGAPSGPPESPETATSALQHLP